MTLTLSLSPEIEERVQRRAAAAGKPIDEFIAGIVEEATRTGTSGYDPTTDPSYCAEWTDEDLADATYASLGRLDKELGQEAGYNA